MGYPGPGGPPGCDNYESTAFGYLYCIGSMSSGQLSAYVYYASLNYTSPDDWLRTADYPMPVTGESCITSNGYVYCVAGVSSGGEVNSAYFSQIVHPLSGKPTNSWVADQGARLSSPPSASPAGIQLPDGRIRLYFCQERVKPAAPGPPGPPPANSQVFVIRSAISRDGLNFTLEPGIRINATGKPGDPRFTVCNPTIVMLKDATYRIYYNGINSSQLTPLGPTNHTMWRIYTAKSDDGLTFTDDELAIDPTNSTWALQTRDKWAALPTARLLPDGRIKIYYEGTGPAPWCPSLCGRAESVVSNDGVHFTWEGAVEFLTSNPKVPPLFNHSWVLLPDGTNMLILYPDRGDPGHPLGFYASYSSGGLVFSSPVEALPAPRDVNLTAFGPPPLTDPELVPLSDGSYRLYYDAIRGSQQQEVYSARWSPLLPEKTEVENVTAVSGNYSVAISHNSSISGFAFDLSSFSISLNLGGPVGFHGHAKISFPTALLSGTIRATLDGSPAQVQINKTGTQTSVGFTFEQGTYTLVQIFGTRSGSLTKTTSSATSSSSTTSSSTSTSSSSMSSSTSVTSSSSYSTTSSIAPNISNVNYLLTGLMVAAALVGTTELFLLVRRK